MKSIKTMRGPILAAVVLGGCLTFSGCASGDASAPDQGASQETETKAEDPDVHTTSYTLSGYDIEIPDYWKADTETSEAGSTLVFRLEDGNGTLSIIKDDIPEIMTVKVQGNDIVEASDEEIADNYISIPLVSSEREQTVGDLEVVECGDSSYMRRTFRGTVDFVDGGETLAAQRSAIVLLDNNSSCIRVTVLCPEEKDDCLEDADELMRSIVNQIQ